VADQPGTDQLGGEGGDGNLGSGVAMTLASITYCAHIKGALNKYLPGWSLVWMPDAAVNGNYAYVAQNDATKQYVVAIRGSLLTFSWDAFDNWFEQDFNVFEQVNWLYPATDQQPKISRGSSDGLNDLSNLVMTFNGQQTRLLAYLLATAVEQQNSIAVVGHSLGGNLATVFAPWLLYQIGQAGLTQPADFNVYTFAAPSAGNTAFAQAYDASFPNSRRYFNVLDIVPLASVPFSIIDAGLLYMPAPQASEITLTYDGETVSLAEAFSLLAAAIGLSEIFPNDYSFYSQTNIESGSVPLYPDDTYCQPKPPPPPLPPLIVQWFEKAGCEHGHNTYLSLLGANTIDCKPVALTP
jgi:triacylglycerol lipase